MIDHDSLISNVSNYQINMRAETRIVYGRPALLLVASRDVEVGEILYWDYRAVGTSEKKYYTYVRHVQDLDDPILIKGVSDIEKLPQNIPEDLKSMFKYKDERSVLCIKCERTVAKNPKSLRAHLVTLSHFQGRNSIFEEVKQC